MSDGTEHSFWTVVWRQDAKTLWRDYGSYSTEEMARECADIAAMQLPNAEIGLRKITKTIEYVALS